MISVALVREHHAKVASFVRALDADTVALPDAMPLWEAFDAIERHASAAKLVLARKVDESGAWKRAGHRNAAEFLAARSGCSMSAARTEVNVSKNLERLAATKAALCEGRLSREQAAAVVDGAAANPKAEQRLLSLARRASVKELREEALRSRTA